MLDIKDLKLLNSKIIDLKAAPGEVIQIQGSNGVGKSLFLKTLARLIPKISGQISFGGLDSSQFAPDLWRSKILYLPSEVSFSEGHSVDEYLNEPFLFERYKNFKSHFNPKEYISDLNSSMNLLSSGQRQRLSILRALSLNADILLLDESFSHIDPVLREETFQLLKQWKEDHKIIFIVSHFDFHISQFKTTSFTLKTSTL
jgi:ABC-type bacteriocin/lantibiotic exporter with double-glycine peptidase domain